jgi:hypothetical protein
VVALLAGGVALGPATTPELVVMTAAGPQADAVVLPGDGVPGVSMTVVVSPGPGCRGLCSRPARGAQSAAHRRPARGLLSNGWGCC